MRPQRLWLTAFGPFAETVEVDFDTLSTFGVFRIHGDTGAGKTTLLDGMTFALFGNVTGSRLAGGLRSQHAEPTTEASAALEFSAQGHDWRITRKPPQMRASKRGGGFKEDKYQSATLLRRDKNQWVPVSTNVTEVNTEIKRLVGLDHQQFTQVVVLPQGEFQRALRATSNERMELLRTLFGTERFDVYAQRLKERAAALKLRRDESRLRLSEIDASARRRAEDLGFADLAPEEIRADSDLAPLALAIQSEVASTKESIEGLDARDAAAREQLDALNLAAQLHERRVGAMRKLALLEESKDEVEAMRAEWEAANRVAPAVPAIERVRATRRRASVVVNALEDAQRRFVAADVDASLTRIATSGVSWSEADAAVDGVSQRLAECDREIERLTEIANHLKDALDNEQAAENVAASIETIAGDIAQIQGERSGIEVRLVEARRLAAKLDALSESLREADGRLVAAGELAEAQSNAAALNDALVEALREETEARTHHMTLVERRIANMAGELAAGLAPGDACVVCGATEHPSLAARADVVDPAEIEAAAEHASRLASGTERARKTLATANDTIAALRAKAGDAAADPEAAEQLRDEIAAQLGESRSGAAEVDKAQKRLDSLGQKAEQLSARLDALKTDHMRLVATASACRKQLERLGGDQTCVQKMRETTELRASLVRLVDEGRRLVEAVRSVEQLQAALAADEAHLAEIAADIGISDVDEIARMVRNEASMKALRERFEDWDRRYAAAKETLADPMVATAVDAPDMTAVKREIDSINAAKHRASERVGQLRSAQREVERLRAQLGDYERNSRAVETAYERAARLSDICNGAASSRNRMSLERYVLAAHLEEIARVASRRLQAMTEGRYSLRHSDAGAARNAASGLGLLVKDAHTGQEREVSTLSGGETFLASLALALGLSDVVQQHAGGVRMDVLFVDEGFGSLDPNKLELALAHLDQVRAGGRVVGIISHVGDLKERIPAGLEVIPGSRGSRVRAAGAPSAAAV